MVNNAYVNKSIFTHTTEKVIILAKLAEADRHPDNITNYNIKKFML